MKNSKDVHDSDRLFAELDGLEWLQLQIACKITTEGDYGRVAIAGEGENVVLTWCDKD